MRKRDQLFVDKVRSVITRKGLPMTDEDCIEVSELRSHTVLREKRIAWVRRKLASADVREALADVFGEYGMDVGYLLGKHREHIESGNYAALKDAMNLVLPKESRKLKIEQRTLSMRVTEPGEGQSGPKEMTARLLGSARVVSAADRDDDDDSLRE